MTRFVPPGEHEVLVFLVQIAVLLLTARVLGQICRKFGQPSVVGELGAGVLLGPSVLGKVAPGAFEWLFPAGEVQSAMLFTVGWMGVILLLVVTGFETDLRLISRLGRAVVWVTAGSLLVPFAFGFGGGWLAPAELRGDDADQLLFALFLAAALTISSLPVIAKIMSELRLLRRNFGQLTLAVGMANDVIGWVVLGLIAGLAQSGSLQLGDFAVTIVGLVVFLALAAVIGQRVIDAVLERMRRFDVGIGGWITIAVVIVFAMGAVTQALGVEAVLGAFVAGILLGRSRYVRRDLEEHLETFTSAVVAPIFFATAGLRIDLSLLGDATVAVWAVVVMAIATSSKFIGAMAGARVAGLQRREGVALGIGLNARGALEIVIATVGLSLGVLNDASYTIVVLMAIATSLMAPPLLRLLVRDWEGSPEERQRLLREETYASNVLVKPGRVLLPTRGGDVSAYAAKLLASYLPEDSPVTLLSVNGDVSPDVSGTSALLDGFDVEHAHVHGDVGRQVVRHASLGYDLLVAAMQRPPGPDAVPEQVRGLLTGAPVPTMIVVPPRARHAGQLRSVLVPMSATRSVRAALEVGIATAARTGAALHLVHVVDPADERTARGRLRATLRSLERVPVAEPNPVGERLLEAAVRTAAELGVVAVPHVRVGRSRAATIVDVTRALDVDLVVLGVAVQDVHGHAFLGNTAERVLATSDAGLAVITLGAT